MRPMNIAIAGVILATTTSMGFAQTNEQIPMLPSNVCNLVTIEDIDTDKAVIVHNPTVIVQDDHYLVSGHGIEQDTFFHVGITFISYGIECRFRPPEK